MNIYIRLVKTLVQEGMAEHKALELVSNAYGVDIHVLEKKYNQEEEVA